MAWLLSRVLLACVLLFWPGGLLWAALSLEAEAKKMEALTPEELAFSVARLNDYLQTDLSLEKRAFTLGILAKAYLQQGDQARAMENCQAAIKLAPADGRFYAVRGQIQAEAGQLEPALLDYTAAIHLAPKNAWIYNNRAVAYQDAGQLEQALADFSEALRLNPKDAAIYDNRGKLYAERGELDRALSDYQQAIRLNPKYAATYQHRGTARQIKGELDEAISDFNKAIRLDPKKSGAYNVRGSAFVLQGKLEEAMKDYDEAIRLAPGNSFALHNRAVQHANRERWQDALLDFDEAIRLAPTSEDYRARALVKQRIGRDETIQDDLQKAIELDPKSAKAYYDRGVFQANWAKWVPAVADLTKATELDSGNVNSLNWLARLLASSPEPAARDGGKAVAAALRACELTAWKDPGIVDTLAAAYAQAGNFEAAVKFEKMALATDGSAEDARPRMQHRLELFLKNETFVIDWKR